MITEQLDTSATRILTAATRYISTVKRGNRITHAGLDAILDAINNSPSRPKGIKSKPEGSPLGPQKTITKQRAPARQAAPTGFTVYGNPTAFASESMDLDELVMPKTLTKAMGASRPTQQAPPAGQPRWQGARRR
jgi:hypothetical protein